MDVSQGVGDMVMEAAAPWTHFAADRPIPPYIAKTSPTSPRPLSSKLQGCLVCLHSFLEVACTSVALI